MSDEDRCPGTNRNGEQCGHPAGWGTENDSGPCKFHGGAGGSGGVREGAGPPEDNTNAVSHGLYAETNRFYQTVIGDQLRELCDAIFADYIEQYRDRHGGPPLGHEARLFEIAVNHIKIIHADNWAVDKPNELESGNPMVDKESKETFVNGVGPVTEHTYSETVVVGTQQKLRREDRAWLKDMGLLDDPESQKATALGDLKDAWVESAQGGSG